MNDPLPVEITKLAAQLIRREDSWWRENRSAATDALQIEVQRAINLISRHPSIGSRATNVRLPGVRRVFLPTVKQFLYYHQLDNPERIEVVALWGARRGEGPPI